MFSRAFFGFAQWRGKSGAAANCSGEGTLDAPQPSLSLTHFQTMNVQFHFFGINASQRAKEMVLPRLEQLDISISSAVVVLDRRRNGGPPFMARVHLAVPGPDIHAEARDHTLHAAWRKVCKDLEKQIEQRKARQVTRAAHAERRLRKVKRALHRTHNGAH
jgi:putative sigma-54 modulation protein